MSLKSKNYDVFQWMAEDVVRKLDICSGIINEADDLSSEEIYNLLKKHDAKMIKASRKEYETKLELDPAKIEKERQRELYDLEFDLEAAESSLRKLQLSENQLNSLTYDKNSLAFAVWHLAKMDIANQIRDAKSKVDLYKSRLNSLNSENYVQTTINLRKKKAEVIIPQCDIDNAGEYKTLLKDLYEQK